MSSLVRPKPKGQRRRISLARLIMQNFFRHGGGYPDFEIAREW